jgi:branched-chain amino acid transport system permease protein
MTTKLVQNRIFVLMIVAVLFLVVSPLYLPLDWVHLFIEIMIMALFATSLNLVIGYTGEVVFGQAAFFGAGAYATALIIMKTNLPFIAAIIAAPVLAAVLAVIFGWFCVRLTSIYFSILTFAFGELVFSIIFKWYSFTGGDDGIVDIPLPQALKSVYHYYYFVLILVCVSILILWLIVNSPFGKTLQAIRENPNRVEFIGANVRFYKLVSFCIGAFFSGIAGGLFCCFNQSVFPVYASWMKGLEPIIMCVFGGMYTFLGPTVGAILIICLEKIILAHTEYWPIFMGSILLCCVIFFKGGILGFVSVNVLRRRVLKNNAK